MKTCHYYTELLQASTGMSSLRRHVGKGMGSIAVEAVYKVLVPLTASYRFLFYVPLPIDSKLTHMPL